MNRIAKDDTMTMNKAKSGILLAALGAAVVVVGLLARKSCKDFEETVVSQT